MKVAQVVAHGAQLGAVFAYETIKDLAGNECAERRAVGRVVEERTENFMDIIGDDRDRHCLTIATTTKGGC